MRDNKNNLVQKFKTKEKMPRIIMLIVVSFLLMGLGQTNSVRYIKQLFSDGTSVVNYGFTSSVTSVGSLFTHLKDLWNIQIAYKQIKEENFKLRGAQQDLNKYEKENQQLKKLLNYASSHTGNYLTTKVLSVGNGALSGGLILFLGSSNGVRPGYIVNTSLGLVGIVTTVGVFTSRVRPITDWGSNVPVLIGKDEQHAIVAGQNNNTLVVLNLKAQDQAENNISTKLNPRIKNKIHIKVGDGVITSGVGGAYPANMKVGYVSKIGTNNKITITPYAEIKGQRDVLVGSYNLKLITDDLLSK